MRAERRDGGRARLVVALLAACAIAWPAHAGAATTEVEVAGRKLALPIPPRMCELQRQLTADQAAFDALAKLQEPRNTLLAAFVACDRLAAFRQRGAEGGASYALVLATRERGSVRPVTGVTRAEFAARVAKEVPKVDTAALAAEVIRQQRASGVFAQATVERVGLAGQDDIAVYIALVVATKSADARAPTAIGGGVALTLVRGIPVSYNHYDRFVDEGTLRRLVADARYSIEALIAENPQAATAVERGWLDDVDWGRVGVAALIGAGAVAAVALGGMLLARRRRW